LRSLLGRASWSERVSQAADPEAFGEAGEYVVDRVDVMLVVQDPQHVNKPGGTADIVDYARRRGVPMVVIDPRTGAVTAELDAGAIAAVAQELENYNRPIPPQLFAHALDVQRHRLLGPQGAVGLDKLAARSLPSFVRADLRALHYQSRYFRVGATVFCLAAAAVTAAATGAIAAPGNLWWGRTEFAILITVIWVFLYGTRQAVVQRWLWYRSLAERLRSAFYLAAGGLGGMPERLGIPLSLQNWVVRTADEVWLGLPRSAIAEPDVPAVREFLLNSWIRDQIGYHERAKQRHERAHRTTARWLWAAVILVVVVAAVHASGRIDEESSLSMWLSLLTVVIPAWGAAIAGVSELKEHRHYKERSSRMTSSLAGVAKTMEKAETPDDLAKATLRTDAVMRQDAEGWMGVMGVHDVPFPT